jgi:WD40 repeat protein
MTVDIAAAVDSDTQAKTKVFVSYSRKDMVFVERLGAALKSRGVEPLIDQTEIAAFDEWWKRIETVIAQADTFVFVISPDSVASQVCEKEIAFAASLNKRLAPIVWRRVAGGAVPAALAKINYIFFDDETRFDASVQTLIEALTTDIAWVRRHTELGEAARRWAVAGRPGPRGLLLRSPMLEEAEHWIATRPANAPAPTEDTQAFIAESRRAATRRRNVLTASLTSGLVVALGLAGLAYWQRGIAIEQQGIAKANEALAREQRDKALVAQSNFLANVSGQRLIEGDTGAAVLLGLEALPDPQSGIARPYVPEAEYALGMAWQKPHEIVLLAGHDDSVVDAAFSPDGRRVVTASSDRSARLWDASSGKQIAILAGHSDRLSSASFSPSGRRIATREFADARVRLWDGESGNAIAVLKGHDRMVYKAVFSPDNRTLITASEDKTARLWDADTGNEISVLKGHTKSVIGAAFSPDGRRVVTVSFDGTARLWDVESGTEALVLPAPASHAHTAVAFSPDGQRVLAASYHSSFEQVPPYGERLHRVTNPIVQLWDVQTGTELLTIRDKSTIEDVGFSLDGRRLLTRSYDTVRLWDTRNGNEVLALRHDNRVARAAFSPDSRTIVTASGRAIRLWDVQSGKETDVLRGHEKFVTSAAFSPDGGRVVTTSEDRTARLWDLGSAARAIGLDDVIRHAVLSPDGRRLVISGSYGRPIAELWDVEAHKAIADFVGHEDLSSAMFSADSKRIVTTSERTAGIWDAMTGMPISVLQGHTAVVNGARLSRDGRRAVTWSADKTVRLWNAETAQAIVALSHEDFVREAVISPDGKRILTSSRNVARLWDAESGSEFSALTGHKYDVGSIAFSPDGRHVATASNDGAARLWDAQTGKEIALLEGHDHIVVSVIFSPDGKRLLTASADKTARLWDVESGKPLSVIYHDSNVDYAAFSADGKRVLTTPFASVRLFDINSGKEILTLRNSAPPSGRADGQRLPQSSSDGRIVLTTSSQKTVLVWTIAPSAQNLVDEVKHRFPRCLSRAQRERAFLDPEPPAWCIELEKWPYHTQDWKDWLAYKRANANPPLPDTPEWKTWLAARQGNVRAAPSDK